MASTNGSSSAAPGPGNQLQRKFYTEDVCTLKADPSMVGIVERTFYEVESHEPLEDSLIVSHVPVPERELMDFLKSGVPAKGCVFVTWSEPTQGSSLVHEDDIELLDRSLEIGCLVKRHPNDTASGAVISTSIKYTLQPAAFRLIDHETGDYGALQFTEKPLGQLGPGDRVEPALLQDVPAEELIAGCDEFYEGSYIIYRQKIGLIQQVDRSVVLMLPSQAVVTPLNPYGLDFPLALDSKPIVSLPNRHEPHNSDSIGLSRPDLSVQADPLYPGQFVRTTLKNLRRGHWTSGAFSENEAAEAHVLATPPLDIHVDWICANIFSVGTPSFGPTSEVLRAGRLQGQAVVYDSGKLPAGHSYEQAIRPGSNHSVGDRVRFRDPAGAVVKYPDFDWIPKDQTFDYDLNIFKIVSVKTEVTVQWQDLSITKESSLSLHKFLGLENEVWPGCLVSLRDEIQTLPNPNKHSTEPLTFTFDPNRNSTILRPKKIGVVQKVNSRERIASVRWYRDPNVELLHNGHVLKPSSLLGELSDEITDVSMYELTTHPGLVKARGEMVLLVPEKIHHSILPPRSSFPSSTAAGPCLLSYLFPLSFTQANIYLDHIKHVLVEAEWFKRSINIDQTPFPPRHSVRRDDFSLHDPIDWIGHIISLDLDGTITVRLGALQNCRDVQVPLEKILMVLDEDATDDIGPSLLDEESLELFNASHRNFIQTIEYEGGTRLGGDSDDDWLTEDDEIVSDSDSMPDLIEIDMSELAEPPQVSDSTSRSDHYDDMPATLSARLAASCPPSFTILDMPPPQNHHFLRRKSSDANTQRLRRIGKEYQILESSLPQGIFARTWESRIDLLRVVIIGPQGTPYEHAPFVIDFYFDDHFPSAPPASYFHSWTNSMGRINPNMYEDGKICLSILGTWPPKNPDENWNPTKSTVLQILVSIMGLVLVRDPFYNEAGFEAFASEGDSRVESTQYTEKAFVMTRGFIKHALQNPVPSFEDVLAWHYLPGPVENDSQFTRPQLLKKAISEATAMICHCNASCDNELGSERVAASPFVARLSLGAVVMLQKHINVLEKILSVAEEQNTPGQNGFALSDYTE